MLITQSGEPKGVLMDVASYEELRRATLLLRLLAEWESEVRAGRTERQDEVFSALRASTS